MYRDRTRIIPIILVLIVIAIAVAALVSAGRALFGGAGRELEVDQGRQALLDTSATHAVRMTVRGGIVAEENFRSYQVTVDPNNRTLVTYTGYLEKTLETKQLTNNEKAYEEFVYALDKVGMMDGKELEEAKNDTRGICPNGMVYEFEVLTAGDTVKRLWTSTCKGQSGSLKARANQLQNLFLVQIPDNQALLRKIKL